ncbi:MAG: PilZ domain-containing protein [Pseudomonadota bacterium]
MKYRHPRRPTDKFVEFEHGLEVIEAQLKDLSRYGARVEGDFNFAGPDELALLFRGRKYPAKIVWMQFGTIGIKFDVHLEKGVYTELLNLRAPVLRPDQGHSRIASL